MHPNGNLIIERRTTEASQIGIKFVVRDSYIKVRFSRELRHYSRSHSAQRKIVMDEVCYPLQVASNARLCDVKRLMFELADLPRKKLSQYAVRATNDIFEPIDVLKNEGRYEPCSRAFVDTSEETFARATARCDN